MYLIQNLDISTISKYLDPIELKLILGMVMGLHTKKVAFDAQIQSVGLTHLLVLSGSNITFLVKFFQFALPIKSLRKRTWMCIAYISCIPLVFGYEPSTLRAVIMAILPLICIISQKTESTLHIIIITGLGMLVYEPTLVANISFQLSFAAVLGMYQFAHNNEGSEGIIGYIKSSINTTLSAQVFTTPLILLHFNSFSTISLLANILVGWSVPVIMILGSIYILSQLFGIEQSSILCSYLLHLLLRYFILVVKLLSKIPFAQINI